MPSALKKVRALPSDPTANDVLKVEYIEVNLNNSRKLIKSISVASVVGTEVVKETESTIEDMLRLRNTRAELAWLDSLVEKP